MDAKTEAAIKLLKKKIATADAVVAKFKDDFARSEVYALEWGQDLFHAVAVREILARYLKVLEDETCTLEQVVVSATDDVLFGARNPPHSTSATDNLMKTALVQVKAEFLDELKWY